MKEVWLEFDTQAEAQEAADDIWINILGEKAAQNEGRIAVDTKKVTIPAKAKITKGGRELAGGSARNLLKSADIEEAVFTEIPKTEKLKIPIYGRKKGEVNLKAEVLRWDIPREEGGKWRIRKPWVGYMDGIGGEEK